MSALMSGFERDTLSAAWRAKRVWLTHVLVNAALTAVFYGWLLIPDRQVWEVGISFVIALMWLTLALWLYAATLQFFAAAHAAPESWRMSWQRTARNIPAFALCAAVFVALFWLSLAVLDRQAQIAGWFHHVNPAFIRTRVSVRTFVWMTHVKIVLFFFVLIPLFLFPWMREGAVRGFGAFTRGWGSAARSFWHLRWWILWAVLFLVTHLPFHLAYARPHPWSLTMQAASMVVRLGIGYLLLITIFVVLASALGRLRRDESPAAVQPMPIENAPKL